LGNNGTQFTRVRRGTGTLSLGTATIADTTITADTEIYPAYLTYGLPVGFLSPSARVPGVSFTITSSSLTDTNRCSYWLVQP
jgi:hypothetical protein